MIIDAGPQFIMVVMPGTRLQKYLTERYRQKVPLMPPPKNPMERWIVSITQSGELLRIAVGVGPRPDIGRA